MEEISGSMIAFWVSVTRECSLLPLFWGWHRQPHIRVMSVVSFWFSCYLVRQFSISVLNAVILAGSLLFVQEIVSFCDHERNSCFMAASWATLSASCCYNLHYSSFLILFMSGIGKSSRLVTSNVMPGLPVNQLGCLPCYRRTILAGIAFPNTVIMK